MYSSKRRRKDKIQDKTHDNRNGMKGTDRNGGNRRNGMKRNGEKIEGMEWRE